MSWPHGLSCQGKKPTKDGKSIERFAVSQNQSINQSTTGRQLKPSLVENQQYTAQMQSS